MAVARTVGDLIADARSRAKGHGRGGMSQAKLAVAMGLPAAAGRSWLGAVEAGNIKKPPPERLRMIADALPSLDFRELLAVTGQLDYLTAPREADTAPVTASATGDTDARIERLIGMVETQQATINRLMEMVERLLPPDGAAVKRPAAAAETRDPSDASSSGLDAAAEELVQEDYGPEAQAALRASRVAPSSRRTPSGGTKR